MNEQMVKQMEWEILGETPAPVPQIAPTPPPAKDDGVASFLKKVHYGLPVWGWGAIGVGVIGAGVVIYKMVK